MRATGDNAILILKDCIVLGASGFPFTAGESSTISFHDNSVTCSGRESIARFSLLELIDISVTGPGTVTTGGGFVGGGFGVEGALEGIALAGVLNMLTMEKKDPYIRDIHNKFRRVASTLWRHGPCPIAYLSFPCFR